MTELSADPQAETRFAAVLTPHRSLSPKGFMVLMALVCIVSFGTGLLFYLLGAWPVIGFMGLDVALIYIAFKLNYPRGAALRDGGLDLERADRDARAPSGKAQSWSFNPYWVRLESRAAHRPVERAVDRRATASGSSLRRSSPTLSARISRGAIEGALRQQGSERGVALRLRGRASRRPSRRH